MSLPPLRMGPHIAFVVALFIFIAVVAPASQVAANALMLDRLALSDVLPVTSPFALGVALTLLALFSFLSPYAPVARLALWLTVFLVAGFQFALFVGNEQLDGAPIDWVSYIPSMGIEIFVLLVGGLLFLRLPMRGIDIAATAAAVFMLLNFLLVAPSLVDLAHAEAKSEDEVPGIAADPFAYANPSPLARFFGTFPPGVPELNSYSAEKNIVVVVIDTLQSDVAEALLTQMPALARQFDGFVSYRNAAAMYPYTGLTLPMIHSGEIIRNGGNIRDFLDRADAQRVERPLAAAGFGISHLGLWQREIYSYGPEATRLRSADSLVWLTTFRVLPRFSKLSLFRTVPNLIALKVPPKPAIASPEYFRNLASLDLLTMRLLIGSMRVDAKRPQFKWIHFWGSHMPSTTSINCTTAEASFTVDAYRDQSTCMLRIVGNFLNAMRTAGVYDVSQIFVIADHGTKAIPVLGDRTDTPVPWKVRSAAHPMLLFKDYGSRGPLQHSDAVVSQLDIKPTMLSGVGLPAGDRTLLKQGSPIVREFYDYTLAAEVHETTMNLRKYRVPDRIRDAAGWAAVP